jgi:hypothetical protein
MRPDGQSSWGNYGWFVASCGLMSAGIGSPFGSRIDGEAAAWSLIAAWQVIGSVQVAITGMGPTMATKITVVLEDDLEGAPADETVRFGIGGTDYEIDLNATNARVSARRAEDSGTGRRGLPPAGSAARTSGPSRKTGASRSAAAAASLMRSEKSHARTCRCE